MDIVFNEKTQMWEEKKEPFGVIEVETEEDFKRLRELVEAERDRRCVVLSEPMKPMIYKENDTNMHCPNCGGTLSGGWPLSDADDYRKMCQCFHCGQSIDDTKCQSAEAALKGDLDG